ncbi:unnamed protein product [Arabis nemorensis]|uniref:Phorbol-ester/DAG-type domain-containing protein n=1 Tax=Arabis nemorensis TaxID=586526 RepID=A0A565BEP7_9BRAS|nr:unnamed protein product [Arabis nemorensis]
MDGETEEELAPRCRLFDPHVLSRRDNPRPSLCFRCGPIGENDEDLDWNKWHYYCDVCKIVLHECCYFAP